MPSKRFKKLPSDTKKIKADMIEKLLPLIKKNCTTKFDESIDLSIQINNKQKKNEINLRTVINMPGGTGKKVKVAVICEESKVKEAKDTKTAFFHHCKLEKLKPNTSYYFLLESDGKFSKPLYFKTAPTSGDFKLLTGGDSRSGTASRCRMNLRMAKEVSKKPEILALVHGGDYIASGTSWRQWRTWLSNHELTPQPDGRVLPIIPTRGNHDGGPLFFEVFNLEKHREDLHFWHTVKVTDDVHIVTLDTNYTAKGAQEQWLDKQLAELRPKSKWLLTNYHRPLFPAVKGPAKQSSVFVPLFEKYNVDLALESDGHCIKRTVPIRNGKQDPTGVVYVGEGGLGVGQRRPKQDHWYLKDGYTGRGHHVMQLSFSKDALEVETIMLEGNTIDKVTLKPRSH